MSHAEQPLRGRELVAAALVVVMWAVLVAAVAFLGWLVSL